MNRLKLKIKEEKIASKIEDFIHSKYPSYTIWYSQPKGNGTIMHIEHKDDDSVCLWINLKNKELFTECTNNNPLNFDERRVAKILLEIYKIKKWIKGRLL